MEDLKLKTKQKIINTAICFYNSKGVGNVTSRHIAEAIGISHGNLEYHFKNKEALLLAIYKQMREEISEVYADTSSDLDPILQFNELLLSLEQFHDRYSFFNLDVLEISRKHEKVNALLQDTLQIRKDQMTHFFRKFIAYKYFKTQHYEGQYMRLQHVIRVLITFWKSQETILPHFATHEKTNMVIYIWDLILPHMTAKGTAAYNTLIKNK